MTESGEFAPPSGAGRIPSSLRRPVSENEIERMIRDSDLGTRLEDCSAKLGTLVELNRRQEWLLRFAVAALATLAGVNVVGKFF